MCLHPAIGRLQEQPGPPQGPRPMTQLVQVPGFPTDDLAAACRIARRSARRMKPSLLKPLSTFETPLT